MRSLRIVTRVAARAGICTGAVAIQEGLAHLRLHVPRVRVLEGHVGEVRGRHILPRAGEVLARRQVVDAGPNLVPEGSPQVRFQVRREVRALAVDQLRFCGVDAWAGDR